MYQKSSSRVLQIVPEALLQMAERYRNRPSDRGGFGGRQCNYRQDDRMPSAGDIDPFMNMKNRQSNGDNSYSRGGRGGYRSRGGFSDNPRRNY